MFRRFGTLTIGPRFESLVYATTLAGAAGAVLWTVLAWLGPAAYIPLGNLILPLIVASGIAWTWRREVPVSRPVGAGVLAWAVLTVWATRYPAFAILLAGAAISLGVPGTRGAFPRVNAALALGVSTFAGVYVAVALASVLGTYHLMPPLLRDALFGAAYGFIAAFGHLATQARWRRDEVERLFRAHKQHGGVPALAAQALHLYRRILETLPARDPDNAWEDTRRTVSRLVLQILGLAHQAQEMAEHLALCDRDDLERRRLAMSDAAAGAADPEARRHYAQTAAVLAQRLDRLRQFSRRRERVEALCHHCLSVLENLRLALAQARLTGQAAGLEEASAALDRLTALQSELDCTAEALRELEPDLVAAQALAPDPVATAATP